MQPRAVRRFALGHRFLPLGVLLGRKMGDLDVDCLHLLKLGRYEAEPVADLVAGKGDVLAFDIRNVHENVVTSDGGRDEAVSFAPAERPHLSLLDGVTHGSVRCGSGPGAPRYDRRRKLQMGRARRNASDWLWRSRDARRGLIVSRYLDVAGHYGYGAAASADTGQGFCVIFRYINQSMTDPEARYSIDFLPVGNLHLIKPLHLALTHRRISTEPSGTSKHSTRIQPSKPSTKIKQLSSLLNFKQQTCPFTTKTPEQDSEKVSTNRMN